MQYGICKLIISPKFIHFNVKLIENEILSLPRVVGKVYVAEIVVKVNY